VLYHYTSPAGLKGILETSSLWATDADFLNDAQELQFGRSQLCDALLAQAESLYPEDREPDGGRDSSRAEVMRNAVDHLRRVDAVSRAKAEQAYVACFCDHDDLLSQWRGYGIGGGYAIGFRSENLLNASSIGTEYRVVGRDGLPDQLEPGPQLRPSLVQVRYGDLAITPMVDRLLKLIAPRPSAHPGVDGWTAAVLLAVPALAAIKHEAFAEEREWRLLVAEIGGQPPKKFRVTGLGLVPYVELSVDLRAALHEIVVGPGNHSEVRTLGVARMLQHLGLEDVSVRTSSAPYRG